MGRHTNSLGARRLSWWLAFLLATFSLACGGGGGGGGAGGGLTPGAAAPQNLTANIQSGAVLLQWQSVATAESYAVWVGSSPGFAMSQESLLGTASGPPVTVGLPPDFQGTLYFKVTGIFAGVSGPPSNEVSVTLDGGGPGPGPGPSGMDPLFQHQWHLVNTGQQGGTPGEDARVAPAWQAGYTGAGVRILIVDDGLDIAHPDLAANVVGGLSYNYQTGSVDPSGGPHGTACGGVAASVGDNGQGGRGAAFRAGLAGVNPLATQTVADFAASQTHGLQTVDVLNNSWGPSSEGFPSPAHPTLLQAIENSVALGRGGLGAIHIFAAGNGAQLGPNDPTPKEDVNLLGPQKSPYVIAIGAVGDDGVRAWYSNRGAALLVSAPSRGRADHGITTTDQVGAAGYNAGQSAGDYSDPDYTNGFGGTSSAAPLVTGVVALMLEANPQLSWRDVRLILARTARKNHPQHPDWVANGAGHLVNHDYGFGVVDAGAAVSMAKTFSSVGGQPAQKVQVTPKDSPALVIPDNNPNGITRNLQVSSSQIQKLESVLVEVEITHPWIGDLEIVLTSPAGTRSVLSRVHWQPSYGPGFKPWYFHTTRILDESPVGVWTLEVRDLVAPDPGVLDSWRLVFLGS